MQVEKKRTKKINEDEEDEKAFVKNKRVTQIRAKKKKDIEHIYDTE
jgi:hypothetical protein